MGNGNGSFAPYFPPFLSQFKILLGVIGFSFYPIAGAHHPKSSSLSFPALLCFSLSWICDTPEPTSGESCASWFPEMAHCEAAISSHGCRLAGKTSRYLPGHRSAVTQSFLAGVDHKTMHGSPHYIEESSAPEVPCNSLVCSPMKACSNTEKVPHQAPLKPSVYREE